MEEIMSMIFKGSNLVKALEFSLSAHGSLETLSNSLCSVSTLFGDANERLRILLERRNDVVPNLLEPNPALMTGLDQMMTQIESSDYWLSHTMMQTVASTEFPTPMPRKRKKDVEETVLLSAARVGNMDIPSDDNYTWRKYGQKEILGSRFPRSYYRCTHHKQYKCPAKKQVQRPDEDPYTFRVTYRGSHTCHFFPTSAIATATPDKVHDCPAIVNMPDEAMFNNIDSVVPIGDMDM